MITTLIGCARGEYLTEGGDPPAEPDAASPGATTSPLASEGSAATTDALASSGVATERAQLNYVAIPHPDDEFEAWALIENSSANYNVFITMTRGERTAYCTPDFRGYAPALGEAPPGDRGDYAAQSCATNRVDSSRAFFAEMTRIDQFLGPAPARRVVRTGTRLGPGQPGYGCAVSSDRFEVWTGRNMALVYFDLGDQNLTQCEVEWAISQVRALRGTSLLPSLPEYGVIAAGFYNARYPRCVVYTHADHRAVQTAVFRTDFGTPGPQYGRTCSTDPDAVRVDVVDQYAPLDMAGDRRVGALQRIYGWLSAEPWPSGDESVSIHSRAQAFWRRF